MDKAKYKKMYEIADRLSKVDTANLNEQQLSEHTAMIEKLKQIAMEDNGFATFMQQLQTTGTDNPVQIVVYGKMPAHMRAEEVWDALMEILPNEYPSIQAAQQKTAEIARYNGAVVAEKPRSEAEKIVKQFNAYGIKARINTSEGVAEGSGKNVVKSVKVGNFRHDLVDTGMGWQVRIYNGDELYDTGMSKNSEQKGLAALEDAVAYTEKQTRTKRQGVAEGSLETDNMVSHIGQVIQSIYPRGGDKNTYMKLVAQEMPRIVKANPKLFRRAFGMAYDRFFHIDQDDDFDYTDYSMRKGERGMEEGVAGPKQCWPGHRKVGTQPGTGKNAGKRVNDCEKIKKEDTYMESLWDQLNTVVNEKAPPGDKYERMVKHIKKGYAKDGKISDKERSIAYATAWKAKNKAKK